MCLISTEAHMKAALNTDELTVKQQSIEVALDTDQGHKTMKKQCLLTMMLTVAVMFISIEAKAVNPLANSWPAKEATINDADYDVEMVSSLTLQVNDTYTLDPVVIPATAQTSFSWYSGDDIVANVSQSGVVTALTVGTTVITAKAANGEKAKCTVTVTSGTPNPTADTWKGSYQVTSCVDCKYVSGYDFPSNYTVTIKELDGAYYVTELIGMDLTRSIYEGLRINVIDEQHAEIDLTFTNDLGYYSMTGCFLSCIYFLSPLSDYELGVLGDGKIGMTRNADGTLAIDDFYVFAYGSVSNFQLAIDAAYYSAENTSLSEPGQSSAIIDIPHGKSISGTQEIYNLNGMLVYSGDDDGKPELAPGVYVIHRGDIVQKVLVH